jgi:hypothetical protein
MIYKKLKKYEEKKARKFLQGIYGKSYYGAQKKYFNWFYNNRLSTWFSRQAANKKNLPINVFVNSKNKIYALNAFFPFDIIYKKKCLKGVWDIEWCSSGEKRGLGRKLINRLVKTIDFYGGFGFNELSAKAYKKIGFSLKYKIPRIVFFLGKKNSRQLFFNPKQVTKKASVANSDYFILKETKEINADLIKKSISSKKICPKKNLEFLQWRFDKNPNIKYKIISMSTCNTKGVGILRIEEEKVTGIKIGRIVELIYKSTYFPDLVKAIINYCFYKKIKLVDYFTTSKEEVERVKKYLKKPCLNYYINPKLPFKFQPLEFSKRTSINMVYKICSKRIRPKEFEKFFSASKADSNQDILRSIRTGPSLKLIK